MSGQDPQKSRRGVYGGYHRSSEEGQGRDNLRAGRSLLSCDGSDGRRRHQCRGCDERAGEAACGGS